MFVLEEFAEKNVEDDKNEQPHEDEREVFDVHWYLWEIIIYVYNVDNADKEKPLITKMILDNQFKKGKRVSHLI